MDAKGLSAEITKWVNEFRNFSPEEIKFPPSLAFFLANRMSDLSGEVNRPPTVVTARIGDSNRIVEIEGARGGRFSYKCADGGVGFGLIEARDIPDKSELDKLLRHMENEGMIS